MPATPFRSAFSRAMAGVLAAICMVLCLATPAAAESRRIALVIGNGGYSELNLLNNPIRDAMLVRDQLEAVGFDVTMEIDVGLRHFQEALIQFENRLAAAGPDAVGVFYYAGHGSEISGVNYLLPVDFDGVSVNAAERLAIGIEDVFAVFRRARTTKNFVILDACRDDGFTQAGGFAQIDASSAAPPGTLIAFSTSPGATALDGFGDNSPYAAALARVLEAPGLSAEEVFRLTRESVMNQTVQKQVPWESSSLFSNVVFRPGAGAAASVRDLEQENERLLWEGISQSENPADFAFYLEAYHDGAFRGLAEARRDAIIAERNALRERERPTVAGHGVTLRPQTVATALGERPALKVVAIDTASVFFGQLIANDMILEIDHTPVSVETNVEHVLDQALSANGRVDLLVRRGVISYSVAVVAR